MKLHITSIYYAELISDEIKVLKDLSADKKIAIYTQQGGRFIGFFANMGEFLEFMGHPDRYSDCWKLTQ